MRPDELALLRTPGTATVSPDGRMAVVAVTRLDLEADEYRARLWAVPTYGTAEGVDADAEPPRLISTLKYRLDDVGFVTDRRSHVFVVEVPADPDAETPVEPVQATDGDVDDIDVAWSPDGERLAFVSGRHDGADSDLVQDVHVVPARGGTPRR